MCGCVQEADHVVWWFAAASLVPMRSLASWEMEGRSTSAKAAALCFGLGALAQGVAAGSSMMSL